MGAVPEAAWKALLDFDREHVWPPDAPLPAGYAPRPVVAAEATRLRLAGGDELIDAMASWWSAIHGHRHPAIVAALLYAFGFDAIEARGVKAPLHQIDGFCAGG